MAEHWTFNPLVLGSNPSLSNVFRIKLSHSTNFDTVYDRLDWHSYKPKKHYNDNVIY